LPHFTIEYSANLDSAVDIGGLVDAVHEAAAATGVFPLKGLRTRACRRDEYRIADRHDDNAFVHVTAYIGHGRSVAMRQSAGEAVFDVVCEYLRPHFESNPLAISFDMHEIDPDTSFKYNNLPEWIERRTHPAR